MRWLLLSLVASVVLTVVLNVAIRLRPDTGQDATQLGDPQRRVRVIVPWKAMLLASIGLTILLNVLIRLV